MNDRQRRIFEAGQRTSSFMQAHKTDFTSITVAQTYVNKLNAAIEQMTQLGAEKVTTTGAAKDATLSRGDRRMLLRDSMRDIADQWKSMFDELDSEPNKFRMPRGGSDVLILSTARSFHTQATPIENEFLARGFETDFLNVLQQRIDDLAEIIDESEDAQRTRIGTNVALLEPSSTITDTIDRLDPIVKRTYRTNAQKLAEWLVASHIERPARAEKTNAGKSQS